MKKVDIIKDESYMVLSGLAFRFLVKNNQYFIEVINLKNLSQSSIFIIRDMSSILFCRSNMSEANKYKSIAIVERNKKDLVEGCKLWVSTQKRE